MNYPPPPGGYPQGMPYPAGPPAGGPERPPTSATAIAAGVVGLIGVAVGILLVFDSLNWLGAMRVAAQRPGFPPRVYPFSWTWIVYTDILGVIWILALGIGSALLIARLRVGQILTVVGAVLAIAYGVLMYVYGLRVGTLANAQGRQQVRTQFLWDVIAVIPAIVPILLAVLPPTNRAIRWRQGGRPNRAATQYPMPGGQQW